MIGDSTTKPVTYEHSFYISQLINTSQPPESIWLGSSYRGNQFYIKEQTGYGRTMTGFGVIAGTAVLAATVESLGQTGGNKGSAK
jgi:frataxin-like iron-binding protein CyaY